MMVPLYVRKDGTGKSSFNPITPNFSKNKLYFLIICHSSNFAWKESLQHQLLFFDLTHSKVQKIYIVCSTDIQMEVTNLKHTSVG